MDSLLVSATDVGTTLNSPILDKQFKAQADSLAINSIKTPGRNPHDRVEVAFEDLYKSLSITASKVIEKLNELLKNELPDGIQSLDPADHTAEKTAERIVTQTTAFFGIFAKQNPGLAGEELLGKFMDTIKGGIDKGYQEAFNILEGLGAFEFEGVKDGVETTRRLIDEKLLVFEEKMKKELGISSDTTMEEQVSAPVINNILAQGGGNLLNVQA